MRSRLVTLSTDAGPAYAAQMIGVLLRRVPAGRVIDLNHDLRPHDITEAAFLLRHTAPTFPPGTIHLVIVDPGVGGARAGVAVRCQDGTLLVGPDNGVLFPLADHLGVRKVVHLRSELVRPRGALSATFHGRDLFAPAAALLATGTPIDRLGRPGTLLRLDLPSPHRAVRGISGRVMFIDRFGNLITNVPGKLAPPLRSRIRVRFGRRRSLALRRYRTYEELPPRSGGVLTSSFGLLEVSVREGSAAERFRVGPGAPVELSWHRPRQDGK